MSRTLCVVVAAAAMAACTSESATTRAREAAEQSQVEVVDPQATALAQEASEGVVKEAQEHLRTLHEYLGEVNGTLDSVTVNAVEAFQRTHGLSPDGLLTGATMRALREAAAAKERPPS